MEPSDARSYRHADNKAAEDDNSHQAKSKEQQKADHHQKNHQCTQNYAGRCPGGRYDVSRRFSGCHDTIAPPRLAETDFCSELLLKALSMFLRILTASHAVSNIVNPNPAKTIHCRPELLK